MTQALTFNDIPLTPIPHQNRLWIRSAELARALGLSREDKVAQIYQRHADEFTSDMTQLIENVVEPQNEVFPNLSAGRCRIFSLRGCHLVAMFARTPVAKAFRKWVLDVLEKYAAEQTALSAAPGPDAALTPDQQCTLQAVVRGKVESIPADRRPRGLYPQIWSRFNNHFRLASYKQLPQSRLSEGIAYLMAMELPAPLPEAPAPHRGQPLRHRQGAPCGRHRGVQAGAGAGSQHAAPPQDTRRRLANGSAHLTHHENARRGDLPGFFVFIFL